LEPRVRLGSELNLGVPFRTAYETPFERLKTRLLTESLAERTDPDLNTPLRRAANEAASLAWATPYPLLFFPALFDEIAEDAARRETRQREIRWTSPRFTVE
jgi:hypothetical protein